MCGQKAAVNKTIKKMKTMRTKILSLVIIAVLAISTTAMAQQPQKNEGKQYKKECMRKPHERHGGEMDRFFTAEQQEKVKAFRIEAAKNEKPLRNELNELKAHQQTLVTADKADMKAIYANIDKMTEVKADMQKIRAKEHQDIRSILTEEQLLKFDEMRGREFGPERCGERPMGNNKGKGMNHNNPQCGQ